MNRATSKTGRHPRLRWAVLVLLCLFGLSAARVFAAEPAAGRPAVGGAGAVKEGETLTLEKCIEIALQNQPSIMAAKSNVYAARSKVGQAESSYYPQASLSAGYSKNSPAVPSSSLRAGTYNDYSVNASVQQNIYDFGKTGLSVKVQEHTLDAVRSDLDTTSIQTVYSVKEAYYGLLLAVRNRDVAADTVRQYEQHLTQAKGFYEAGTKPRFDVTKAEVDLSNAKLGLIKAENAVKMAKATLNNAMGVLGSPEYSVEDNLGFKPLDITFDAAYSKALENRPDLKSSSDKRKAAEESVELSRRGYYPSLSGNAEYGRGGQEFPLREGWNVGATLTVPIFSGFLTKYQVEESRANLNAASANEDAIRQTVFFDVRQAYLNLKAAQESVPAAEVSVKQAEENLDLANGRYAAGVGSSIEVTDAQVSYATARTAYIKALSDYKVAEAALEKAMGVR